MGYSIFDKSAVKSKLVTSNDAMFDFGEVIVDVDKYNKRLQRRYKPTESIEDMRRAITSACSLDELVDFSLYNGLCDYCDFSGLNSECARSLVLAVAESCFRYPLLRANTCFIGSISGMQERMRSAASGSEEIIVQFELEGIIRGSESVKKLGKEALKALANINKRRDEVLAFAFSLGGLFDAIVLDTQDFGGIGYKTLKQTLEYNVSVGYHPLGCDDTDSIVYHEIGHLLDNTLNVSDSAEFAALKREYTPAKIAEGLSRYAAYNAQEMLAEGFAEYRCNKNPRPLARKIGELIDAASDRESR